MMNYIPSMDRIASYATYLLPVFHRQDPFWQQPITNLASEDKTTHSRAHRIGVQVLVWAYEKAAPYLPIEEKPREVIEKVASNLLHRISEVVTNTLVLGSFFLYFLIVPEVSFCSFFISLYLKEPVRELANRIYQFVTSTTVPVWAVFGLVTIATWPFFIYVTPLFLSSYIWWDVFRSEDDKYYFRAAGGNG